MLKNIFICDMIFYTYMRIFRYIKGNPKAIAEISSKKSSEMSEELFTCFSAVGFTDQEIDNLFSLLAGVLYAGDLVCFFQFLKNIFIHET